MLDELIKCFVSNSKQNHISASEEAGADAAFMIYGEPITGYACADDDIFTDYREDERITSGRFMPPKEWLPEAKTVVSVFLPFTQEVKKSNARDRRVPSLEWLIARFEGQTMINSLSAFLQDSLRHMGYKCVAPSIDSRFRVFMGGAEHSGYGSNWSERHVAYAAGLGTFGLSRGIITRKGVAGRFTSIITDLEHIPLERDYEGIYDYCAMCGACVKNCPAEAITLEKGKDHPLCSAFLDSVKEVHDPRYACGKCQAGMPCESGIPRRS